MRESFRQDALQARWLAITPCRSVQPPPHTFLLVSTYTSARVIH